MFVNLFLCLNYCIEDINSHLTRIFLATRDDTVHVGRLCTIKAIGISLIIPFQSIQVVYNCLYYYIVIIRSQKVISCSWLQLKPWVFNWTNTISFGKKISISCTWLQLLSNKLQRLPLTSSWLNTYWVRPVLVLWYLSVGLTTYWWSYGKKSSVKMKKCNF